MVQGQHTTSHSGSGLTPAELREYVPGDNIDRIDWKATARLATVHIREYEPETDQPTTIVVDHRAALDAGPDGETKLDYVRDVALSMVVSARRLGTRSGYSPLETTVSRNGWTTRPNRHSIVGSVSTSSTSSRHSDHVRETEHGTARQDPLDSQHTPGVGQNDIAPTTARVALRELESGGHSAFSRTLGPFYRHRQTYRTDIESEPLRGAIRTVVRRRNRRALMVLCTDDSDRVALTEAVHVARTGGSRVLVLITPSVLFDAESPAALEESFDRYVAFEEFRRKLDRLEGSPRWRSGRESNWRPYSPQTTVGRRSLRHEVFPMDNHSLVADLPIETAEYRWVEIGALLGLSLCFWLAFGAVESSLEY